MQLQREEAKAMVIKEREAARKAIEDAPPVIKETPVIIQDTEKIDSLTAELESVKVRLLSSYAFQKNPFFCCMFSFYLLKTFNGDNGNQTALICLAPTVFCSMISTCHVFINFVI